MPARNARFRKPYVQVEEEEGENEEQGEGEEDEGAAGVEVDQEETEVVVEGEEQPTHPRPLVDEPSTSSGARYTKDQRKRVRVQATALAYVLCTRCWLQAVFATTLQISSKFQHNQPGPFEIFVPKFWRVCQLIHYNFMHVIVSASTL